MQFRHDINKYRKGDIRSVGLITERCWGEHLSEITSNNAEYVNDGVNHLSAEVVLRDWDLRFDFVHFHIDRPKTAKNRRMTYNEHIFPWRQFCTNYRNATFEEGIYDTVVFKPQAGMFHSITANSEDFLGREIASTRSPRMRAKQNDTLLGMTEARGLYGASFLATTVRTVTDAAKQSELLIPSNTLVVGSDADLAVFDLVQDDPKTIPVASVGFSPLYTGNLQNTAGSLVDMQMEVLVVVRTTVKEYRGTSYQYKYGGCLVQPDPQFGRMVLGKYEADDLQQIRHSSTALTPYKDTVVLGATTQKIPPALDITYEQYFGQKSRLTESDIVVIEDVEPRTRNGSGYNLRKRRMKLTEGNVQVTVSNQAASVPNTTTVSSVSSHGSRQTVKSTTVTTTTATPQQQGSIDTPVVAKPPPNVNSAKRQAVTLTPEQKAFMAKLSQSYKDYNKKGYYTVLVAPSPADAKLLVMSKIPNPWAAATSDDNRKRRHAVHHMLFPPAAMAERLLPPYV